MKVGEQASQRMVGTDVSLPIEDEKQEGGLLALAQEVAQ